MIINELMKYDTQIDEEVATGDLGELADQLDAAKRGLGLASKLKDPKKKKEHVKRTITNLNKIRGALVRQLDKIE